MSDLKPYMIERACPSCGAVHTVWRQDLKNRERGSFSCLKCGAEALRWNGGVDYEDWQLKPDNE